MAQSEQLQPAFMGKQASRDHTHRVRVVTTRVVLAPNKHVAVSLT